MLKSENYNSNHRPAIQINFRLDENGNPLYIQDKDIWHYKIHISIINIPEDTYAVNYLLHPSYISAFREQRNQSENFGFNTTTYGDYVISAELMGKKVNTIVSGLVSELLSKYYWKNGARNAEINKAIEKLGTT